MENNEEIIFRELLDKGVKLQKQL